MLYYGWRAGRVITEHGTCTLPIMLSLDWKARVLTVVYLIWAAFHINIFMTMSFWFFLGIKLHITRHTEQIVYMYTCTCILIHACALNHNYTNAHRQKTHTHKYSYNPKTNKQEISFVYNNIPTVTYSQSFFSELL